MKNDVITPVATEAAEPTSLHQVMPGDELEPVREAPDSGMYTEYDKEHGRPFLVDHYDLGTFWNRGDMYSDAYVGEVNTINQYLEHQLNKGEIGNSLDAVKGELKRIEKMINVPKDSRTAVRVGMVSEFVKFLLKTEGIKRDSAKYGKI